MISKHILLITFLNKPVLLFLHIVKWFHFFLSNTNNSINYSSYFGGARGVMVIVVGNGHGDSSSNPDCISHSTNTLGKGMNPIILPPAMGK